MNEEIFGYTTLQEVMKVEGRVVYLGSIRRDYNRDGTLKKEHPIMWTTRVWRGNA